MALDTTLNVHLNNDGVVYGNSGNAELIVASSRYWREFGVEERAKKWLDAYVSKLMEGIRLKQPETPSFGFMNGSTGVAYQALRIAHPALVPSLLC